MNVTAWRGYALGFLLTAPIEAELDTLAVSLDSSDFYWPDSPLPAPDVTSSRTRLTSWSSDAPPDCPGQTDVAFAQPIEHMSISPEMAAKLAIHRVPPMYSPLARTARIQGTVDLAVVIGCTRAVREVRVLSGQPMLVAGAVDAVRQWRTSPTCRKANRWR